MNANAENSRPLVSAVVFAYMQEDYIEAAVTGMLSQTYEPMEIILSDDASGDRTGEIMERLVRAYQGPHKIILNRNERNMGFGNHVNKVLGMCSGEWIVMGAGDDISRANRVESVMREVEKDPEVVYLTSDISEINDKGQTITAKKNFKGLGHAPKHGDFLGVKGNFMGAAAAFHRKLITEFGPMGKGANCEDRVYAYRGWLTGNVSVIDEVLVDRRIHDTNLTGSLNNWNERAAVLAQHYVDLLWAERQGLSRSHSFAKLNRELLRELDLVRFLGEGHHSRLGRCAKFLFCKPRYLKKELLGWKPTAGLFRIMIGAKRALLK